jgi:hypothetical protein
MASSALSIKLRCASWQQLSTIYKRDLSRGSMFLKAASPPPIGTSVRIDLTLPSASVIVLTGVVEQHVHDPQRGQGVELKLAPIPTGSIWLIESALASEQRRQPTPASGIRQVPLPPTTSGPVASMGDGEDMAAAENELIRALVAEADSLKKLNPFLVLGVGYEATDGEVRAAFGELTKRYHPDRFARYESAELRQVAAEIFILIRDAYRRLGDASGRTQALAALGRTAAPRPVPAPRAPSQGVGPPPIPTAKTTQAIPVAIDPSEARPSGPVARAKPAPIRVPHVPPVPQVAPPLPPPPATPPPITTERRPVLAPPPPVLDGAMDPGDVESLIDAGRVDEALAAYKVLAKKQPQDRTFRAGVELCEGLRSLTARDRLEAAQRFEAALEIDPSNERAARELADMRRQATNERKGLLSRLMGKKES